MINIVPRNELMSSLNQNLRVVAAIEQLLSTTIVINGTTSGTNTGDDAVNSLYSGLVTNATHTGEVTGNTTLTITAKAVTLAKMADVATATVFYRKSVGTGVPEVQTLATLKTDLGLTGTNTGDNAPIPEYASNIAALAGGLVDGQLFRQEAYPHTVRSVIISSLITSDGYTLFSSDDFELIPYIY